VSPRRPERSRPRGTSALVPRVEPLAVGSPLAAPAGAVPHPPPQPSQPVPPTVPDPGTPDPGPGTHAGPNYLRFVRRDLRARAEQLEAVAALRRRITADRARAERSERITDNTLIRVAIDLLLAHGDELAGATEDQIRESALRAAPPRYRS
jgi:hypothetical protein